MLSPLAHQLVWALSPPPLLFESSNLLILLSLKSEMFSVGSWDQGTSEDTPGSVLKLKVAFVVAPLLDYEQSAGSAQPEQLCPVGRAAGRRKAAAQRLGWKAGGWCQEGSVPARGQQLHENKAAPKPIALHRHPASAVPCPGVCVPGPKYTKIHEMPTGRKGCVCVEISARFRWFLVGAAGER